METAQAPKEPKRDDRSARRRRAHDELYAWRQRQKTPQWTRPSACQSVRRLLQLRDEGKAHPAVPPRVWEAAAAGSKGAQKARAERGEEALPDNLMLKSRVAASLAGWIVLCCLVFRHQALIGKLVELAELLGCSKNSVGDALAELEEKDYLEREHRFVKAPGFISREGRVLRHRQICNAYRPGPQLIQAYRDWQAGVATGRKQRRERAAEQARARNSRRRAPLPRDIQDHKQSDPPTIKPNTTTGPAPTPSPVDNSPSSVPPVELGGDSGSEEGSGSTPAPQPVVDTRARGFAASHLTKTANGTGFVCASDQVLMQDILPQLANYLLPLMGTPEALEAHGLVEQAQRELAHGREQEARHSLVEASRWLDLAARTRERPGWLTARMLLDQVLGKPAP